MTIECQSPIAANVWKVNVSVGDHVDEDEELVILESMKMEIPIESPSSGTVVEIMALEGSQVTTGDVLVILEAD